MKKLWLSLLVAPFLCLASCSKQGHFSSIQDVFTFGKQPVQSFKINAGTGGKIKGKDGIVAIFPPGAFVTNSGQAVTGEVEVVLQEFLHPGDMIFSKMLPVYNGNPLRSGGEFILSARKGSQMLKLANGIMVQVKVPQRPPVNNSGMKLFYGAIEEDDINNVTWTVADSAMPGYLIYNGDTIDVFTNFLGACNIDAFIPNPQYIQCSIDIDGLPAGTPDADIRAYAIFVNFLGVIYAGEAQNHTIHMNLVAEEPIKLAVMAVADDEFYANTLLLTPVAGEHYSITLAPADVFAFKESLN